MLRELTPQNQTHVFGGHESGCGGTGTLKPMRITVFEWRTSSLHTLTLLVISALLRLACNAEVVLPSQTLSEVQELDKW